MKKTILIASLLAVICIAISSCRASKPACPAYSSVSAIIK